ncbi:MAG: hypothetical protein RL522_525 [Pseudomonadota bacterium]|jgi:branched-subunit amino acid transport protein
MTDLWTMAVIGGLAVVTVITRGFFVFSSRPWRLPVWAERGLQYAPIAALVAVVVPEVVMTQGQLVATGLDARIFGAAVGMAVFYWRRNTLLTIVAGMAVYLPLHLLLGW